MTGIEPTRDRNFPEWFQQVVKAADMAENSSVRGCMVIKPWGYAVWELMQRMLDDRIKETGHENAYFPLFIPLHFLEKEAAHIKGFAKECAVVTHHRLEEKEGKLVPTGELEEPLIVRPTSEMIIGKSFSGWVKSYRDLPLLINQWANVVRWEMRPRIFLRTTEFLWQEGHTVHATREEAEEETMRMLAMYREFMEKVLAIPVIAGEKSPGEKFPGAENTYTLEAMMQDGKALQACTSHYLGQNFSKGSDIRFSNKEGELEYAYTTSWGMTTRLIGALIMCHGDDDGLRLPPAITPKHVVILPVIPKAETEKEVLAYAEKIAGDLRSRSFRGRPLSVSIDKREKRGGEKNWEWIKKGVPLRLEIGPRDRENGVVTLSRRDISHREKITISSENIADETLRLLEEIQENYYCRALNYQRDRMATDLKNFEELKEFFAHREGFVLAKWCGEEETEKLLEELKISVRCLPLEQSKTSGTCILTGKPATLDAVFAKSY